ncbi:hypothetical protein EHYA_03878 [Embleya hyalina]|uniref:Knr4/Smi1-like domain-containing protein n=1 Tax=Embleya hyalina TaxID=516124 RepID=A0A401YNK1_9ACTN|nr:hypothetical protein EHYA_03878 [Embleya hyalina]
MIEDLLARPLPVDGEGVPGLGYDLVDLGVCEGGPAFLHAGVAVLRSRFGAPRAVAVDGVTDPSLRDLPGPPLSDVLVGRAVEMYGWTVGRSWLGVGLLADDDCASGEGARPAAVRAPLHPVRPAGSSWAEDLAALTGWRRPPRIVDWEAAERALGLRLPDDYKQLAEVFGAGSFDDNLDLRVPGSRPEDDLDLIVANRDEFADPAPADSGPLRLLEWAGNGAGYSFSWLVEDPDPQRWPVCVRIDAWDPWERFDCSATEFVLGMLTDPRHPYTLARHFETHWFTSVEDVERARETFRDEYHPRF